MSFEEFKRHYARIDWRLLAVNFGLRKQYDMATRTTSRIWRPDIYAIGFALRCRTADREGWYRRGQWVWPWRWAETYYRIRFGAGPR